MSGFLQAGREPVRPVGKCGWPLYSSGPPLFRAFAMFTVLAALVLLSAGVVAIYLILKNMSEEGIDIAAPGSCKRGSCGTRCRPPVEEAEEAPLQAADAGDQGKATS